MDGLKFDLRIYVLVLGVDPLRIFLYQDGLARLATEPYEEIDHDNIADMCMHLTNYAINKHSEYFVHNKDAEDDSKGHKRSLKYTLKYLA
jgi:tubulin polyglutamylase TTLL6/13